MKTTGTLPLLALAVAAGSAVLTAAPAQAAPRAGAPFGPTPTDVCAQQLAAAPVVGRLPAVNGACTSISTVDQLVHHPIG